ncbi:MAG: hypothetical protein AAF721_37505, partial [Myxococcota bacterium]
AHRELLGVGTGALSATLSGAPAQVRHRIAVSTPLLAAGDRSLAPPGGNDASGPRFGPSL